MASRKDGVLDIIFGMTRCGKTSLIVERIKNSKRLLVMDRQGQFAQLKSFDWVVVHTPWELDRIISNNLNTAELAISYQPRERESFGAMCQFGYAWGIARPCTVVTDELAQFTAQGKACQGWDTLVNMGLKYQINIIGAAQRAQEIDNTTRGQATNKFVFKMGNDRDEKFIVDSYKGIDQGNFPQDKYKYLWVKPDGNVSAHTTKKF